MSFPVILRIIAKLIREYADFTAFLETGLLRNMFLGGLDIFYYRGILTPYPAYFIFVKCSKSGIARP